MKNIMKKMTLSAALLCAGCAALFSQSADLGKNVAQVEFRPLPGNFETLPMTETEKWNFTFRPYSSADSAHLWSDPNAIRSVMSGETTGGTEMTGMYVCCDYDGLNILVYGTSAAAMEGNLKKGISLPDMRLETYILPGDADDQKIENYQPYGYCNGGNHFDWELSWMKWDRKNRPQHSAMRFDYRYVPHGCVVRIFYPWILFFDRLPVFGKKADNFWRLGLIRWGAQDVTWGGLVHSQIALGCLRMPDFTQEQKTQFMKTILLKCWTRYQDIRSDVRNDVSLISGRDDFYRVSQKDLPKSFMNVNEDFGFQDAWLLQALKDRDAIGAGIADFEKLTPAEQEAFYQKNAKLLYNFDYDIQEAYAEYLNNKIMNH